jgi:acetyl esterase/lipase
MDAQRAIRIVKSRAAEWGIYPDRVGIWGFSAGGHLASTAGTHFDNGRPDAEDAVERASSRPDFLILGYPVVTMDADYTHAGSRACLIGEDPSLEWVDHVSNEMCVTSETPPVFLFHTDEDEAVPPENSVNFYLALRRARVPAELHIYRTGQHGVGLAQEYPLLKSWPDLVESWMRGLGLFDSP